MLRRRAGDSASSGEPGEQLGPDGQPLDLGPQLDPLTGLLERNEWLDIARTAYRRAEHDNQRFAAFFIRLEGMSDLNDLFGPEDADQALQVAATRLISALGDQVPIGRWAGAEICLLWPAVSTVDAATRVAMELASLLAEPAQLASSVQPLICRVGGTLFDLGFQGSRPMIDDAHDALVEAASRSDRTPVVRDESTRNRLTTRADPGRLQEALERHEFRVVWQPIVSLETNKAIGFEALLRWEDTRAGTHLVPASEFLPLLERTGMIVEVGNWVVAEACRQVKEWNDLRPGAEPLLASVNLGGRQIEDPRFAENVVQALDLTGLPPELLCLDITDWCLATAGMATWGYVRPLKMVGVKLALDGLGAGVSALEYLRELQVDMVRIDSVFVSDISTSPDDRKITASLISLAHDLGLTAVAQGVENQDSANVLVELGCDLAQGFSFGKPALAEEIGVPS